MHRTSKWLTFINIFGTFGYLSVLAQWSWSFLIAVYPLLVSKPALLFPKDTPIKPIHVAESGPFWAPVIVCIAIAIAIIVVIITIVVIFRAPKSIGKHAAQITHSTAKAIVPAFVGNTKISQKKQRKLSYQIIIAIKVLLVLTPLIVLFFAGSLDQVPDRVVWVVAFFCAGWSLAYFAIQLLIARLTRVDTTMVW